MRGPFRLDLTVDALRRLASNVVDVVSDGTYYRALSDEKGTAVLEVRRHGRGRARDPAPRGFATTDRWIPVVARMLGTQVDLTQWYARSRRVAWLARLTTALRGLKPPRYPTLWEGCVHAILFQQISIYAAGAIMRRAVEVLGESVTVGDIRCVAFPPARRWLGAADATLRAAGISRTKIAHLRCAADAFVGGEIDEDALEQLPTHEAAQRLCAIRGIGAWSASVDASAGPWPPRCVSTARFRRRAHAIAARSEIGASMWTGCSKTLGSVRGMLYYQLLLGRIPTRCAVNDQKLD